MMTFKEKLVQISNDVEFELFVAKQCTKIRDAIEDAARSGYRTFQIDIVQPVYPGTKVLEANATNCFTITCMDYTAAKCVLVAKRIEDYLKQLGFEDVDSTNISNACYLITLLKVEW